LPYYVHFNTILLNNLNSNKSDFELNKLYFSCRIKQIKNLRG
jgi:hypothetical protein